MRIFTEKTGSYNQKINFVDENDVFVGFDMAHDCCEVFGWFINHEKLLKEDYTQSNEKDYQSLDGWLFDKTFIETHPSQKEGGALKIFRIHKGDKELFIHIYNYHNGYYSHGFQFKDKDSIIEEGSL